MKSKYHNKSFLEKEYAELKNGRLIAEKYNLSRALVYRWLKEFGITSKKYTHHHVNELYFDKIDSHEKAYFLGLIAADGCIYKGDSDNSYVFQINLSQKDRDILFEMQKAFDTDYPVIDFVDAANKYLTKLKISNTKFCKNLMKHGIRPHKTESYDFPEFISEEFINSYLRGFFDGDGNIYINKKRGPGRARFSIIGNLNFLLGLQRYLTEKFDIASGIYKCAASTKVKNLEVCAGKALHTLYHFMYDGASLFYKRKKDIFDECEKYYVSRQTEMSGQ